MDEQELASQTVALIAQNALEREAEKAARRALVPSVVRARAEAFVAKERGLNGEEKFEVSLRTRQVQERVERHQRTERELHLMGSDIGDAMGKGMRSRQALDSLESRVLTLRESLRNSNDRADQQDAMAAAQARSDRGEVNRLRVQLSQGKGLLVRTATERVQDELGSASGDTFKDGLEPCPKCQHRFLPGMLSRHLVDCMGEKHALPPLVFDSEEEDEWDWAAEEQKSRDVNDDESEEWDSEAEAAEFEGRERRPRAAKEGEGGGAQPAAASGGGSRPSSRPGTASAAATATAAAPAGAGAGAAAGDGGEGAKGASAAAAQSDADDAPPNEFDESPKGKRPSKGKRVGFMSTGIAGPSRWGPGDAEGGVRVEDEGGVGSSALAAEDAASAANKLAEDRNALAQCFVCMRKVLPKRLAAHQKACMLKQQLENTLGGRPRPPGQKLSVQWPACLTRRRT